VATDQATESLPDQLSSIPRIDVTANRLRMSVDVLLGHLRNQRLDFNPGDRVPVPVVLAALQAELGAGRFWQIEQTKSVGS
jgi:hypothetical protein